MFLVFLSADKNTSRIKHGKPLALQINQLESYICKSEFHRRNKPAFRKNSKGVRMISYEGIGWKMKVEVKRIILRGTCQCCVVAA